MGLKNIELYRKFRLFRNLKKATSMTFDETDDFKLRVDKFLKAVTLAPEVSVTVVDSDYSCRASKTEDAENPWNVFFHFKIKISNLGHELTGLEKAYLKVKGYGEKLEPKVYDNEGGAFDYIKGGKYESPMPGESEQVIPLNFIMPSQNEKTKGLKTTLTLNFKNCRRQVIPVIVSRVR